QKGHVLEIVLLLHNEDIPIDTLDEGGHTPLMWAAYNAHPQCVDLCLRHGANIAAVDDNGSTALHWALVKGNYACIQKLIEYGSDRFAENDDGKTPAVVAKEMGSEHQWWKALDTCGFNRDGTPKNFGRIFPF